MNERSVDDALYDSSTVQTAGRATSTPARPAELDDPNWLAKAYRQGGDRQIARTLNVSASAVLRARQRLGIQSAPAGRRQGAPNRDAEPCAPLGPTLALIAERFRTWQKHNVPPTEGTLIAAIRALHEARAADHQHAYQDALVDLATSAALIHDHQRKVI